MSTLNSNKPLDNPNELVKDRPHTMTKMMSDQPPKTPCFQRLQEIFLAALFNWIQRPAKAISGLGKAIVIGTVLLGLLLAPIRPPSAWGATDTCKVRNLEGELQTVPCWALLC